jgi:hypothetical protein
MASEGDKLFFCVGGLPFIESQRPIRRAGSLPSKRKVRPAYGYTCQEISLHIINHEHIYYTG